VGVERVAHLAGRQRRVRREQHRQHLLLEVAASPTFRFHTACPFRACPAGRSEQEYLLHARVVTGWVGMAQRRDRPMIYRRSDATICRRLGEDDPLTMSPPGIAVEAIT